MTTASPSRTKSGVEARFEAQRIAFAPIIFQAARALRDLGVLGALRGTEKGLAANELAERVSLSPYAASVLLEAGRVANLVRVEDDRYHLTDTGYFILVDELTRINMDVVQDCCYQALYFLDESVQSGAPVGLQRVFGNWDTIYPALPTLPEPARTSWYRWDHYYSDAAFPQALPHVFEQDHRSLLDIGGNTGKWALQCVGHSPDVSVTIVDLPETLKLTSRTIADENAVARIHTHPMNLLDHDQPIPSGFDAVWMSQFLVCFGEDDVVRILKRVAASMNSESTLYILDTFPDRQAHPVASYSLEAISLYFTVLANGRSRMYKARDILRLLESAGLCTERIVDNLGICSSLIVATKRS